MDRGGFESVVEEKKVDREVSRWLVAVVAEENLIDYMGSAAEGHFRMPRLHHYRAERSLCRGWSEGALRRCCCIRPFTICLSSSS
jgi:hypothetical protein